MLTKHSAAHINIVIIVITIIIHWGARGQEMRAHRIPTFITSPQRWLQETSAPIQVAGFVALLKSIPIRQ